MNNTLNDLKSNSIFKIFKKAMLSTVIVSFLLLLLFNNSNAVDLSKVADGAGTFLVNVLLLVIKTIIIFVSTIVFTIVGTALSGQLLSIEGILFNKLDLLNLKFLIEPGSSQYSGLAVGAGAIFKLTFLLSSLVMLILLIIAAIKILFSETATGKSDAKESLLTWLKGILVMGVILITGFFIIYANNFLVEVLEKSLANGGDLQKITTKLFSKAIFSFGTAGNVATIVYIAILIQTLGLAIKYFKRTVTVLSLIAVAPVMAINYGMTSKASGLSSWVKSLGSQVFIQLVHIIMYLGMIMPIITMVANTGDMENNFMQIVPTILFAYLVIGFFDNAEKLMKSIVTQVNDNEDIRSNTALIFAVGAKAKDFASKQRSKIKAAENERLKNIKLQDKEVSAEKLEKAKNKKAGEEESTDKESDSTKDSNEENNKENEKTNADELDLEGVETVESKSKDDKEEKFEDFNAYAESVLSKRKANEEAKKAKMKAKRKAKLKKIGKKIAQRIGKESLRATAIIATQSLTGEADQAVITGSQSTDVAVDSGKVIGKKAIGSYKEYKRKRGLATLMNMQNLDSKQQKLKFKKQDHAMNVISDLENLEYLNGNIPELERPNVLEEIEYIKQKGSTDELKDELKEKKKALIKELQGLGLTKPDVDKFVSDIQAAFDKDKKIKADTFSDIQRDYLSSLLELRISRTLNSYDKIATEKNPNVVDPYYNKTNIEMTDSEKLNSFTNEIMESLELIDSLDKSYLGVPEEELSKDESVVFEDLIKKDEKKPKVKDENNE